MSPRPSAFTQAEIARALRAAKDAGPEWVVEVSKGVLRFRQDGNETGQDPSIAVPEALKDEREPEKGWSM
jgi:hypothetical protein